MGGREVGLERGSPLLVQRWKKVVPMGDSSTRTTSRTVGEEERNLG